MYIKHDDMMSLPTVYCTFNNSWHPSFVQCDILFSNYSKKLDATLQLVVKYQQMPSYMDHKGALHSLKYLAVHILHYAEVYPLSIFDYSVKESSISTLTSQKYRHLIEL